jgi:hypothetical protein
MRANGRRSRGLVGSRLVCLMVTWDLASDFWLPNCGPRLRIRVSSAHRPPQRGFRRNSRAENSRHAVRRTKAQASGSIHAAVSWTSQPSGKIPDRHSIGSITDNDLGVFPVTILRISIMIFLPSGHIVRIGFSPRAPAQSFTNFNRGVLRSAGFRHVPRSTATRRHEKSPVLVLRRSAHQTLPVNFWQSRQWHTVALVGSVSAV